MGINMFKAVIAAIISFNMGLFGMLIGMERMKGNGNFGLLVAIVLMGAFIIYFNEKKK